MWGRGAFALKPLLESDDKMTLEVQLVWREGYINKHGTEG
jgi:hypothetical protein